MATDADLVIIGAGPAGLAAARQAAGLGLSVTLLDEQAEPGGQIYRAIGSVLGSRPETLKALGSDYAEGAGLADGIREAAVDYRPGSTVWNIGPDLAVHYSTGSASGSIRPQAVLAATGAVERAVPIPGWTLPGVLTAGALQIMLKGQGLVPDGRLVLAGGGPLLILLATQLIAAGSPPAAIVETVPRGALLSALRHLPGALGAPDYLRKGLAMIRAIKAAGIPYHREATGLRIDGNGKAEALSFSRGGDRIVIEADIVALHQGVVPNQQISRLLGCDHRWDSRQRCFHPTLDPWGATSVDGLYVAGDSGGIGGARVAAIQGRLSALAIAARLGRIDKQERNNRAAADRAALRRQQAIRPLLDTLYPPSPEVLKPDDDVMVCRCEEVTVGALRASVREGCPGPNQAKAYLRCGMGPCQGRICGLPVTEIIADARGLSPAEIGYYRIRPPLKPITLAELSALDGDDDA